MNLTGDKKSKELEFLISALSTTSQLNNTLEVLDWLKIRNEQVRVSIQRTQFKKLTNWDFNELKGTFSHSSGKFFSIDGVNVMTNWRDIPSWDQPIINQPEIGFLGIITKEINGVLHFLMQAKIEPGNINYVQISPTLQATKSNYSQVHQGRKPLYLDFFQERAKHEILLDQLQSEQGARFLRKRNRNIIIKVSDEIQTHEDFTWLTLGQLKELMRFDNVVNMDTRTVISSISYGNHLSKTVQFYNALQTNSTTIASKFLQSELESEIALHSFDDIIHWFTQLKTQYDLEITPKPLRSLKNWSVTDDSIAHVDGKYFEVIAVNIEIGNREVRSWDQPLISPVQQGICAFIVKEIFGVIHFLVQAKLECGNFDILEMAPTVQCLTGSYDNAESLNTLPYLKYVLEAGEDLIIYDTCQSEEGGRFYREQNRNMIILCDESIPVEVPDNYIWMTLNQMKTFIKFNNYLNIQARNLIASINYV